MMEFLDNRDIDVINTGVLILEKVKKKSVSIDRSCIEHKKWLVKRDRI